MPDKKKKIGLIAGVFDLVHAGHILALRDARAQCGYLIVALHNAPINPSKNQPVMSLEEREIILRGYQYVDEIVTYRTEHELLGILTNRRRSIAVRFLGEDYKSRPFTGCDLPIETRFLSRDHNWSTSELRARVYAAEVERIGGVREPIHAVR